MNPFLAHLIRRRRRHLLAAGVGVVSIFVLGALIIVSGMTTIQALQQCQSSQSPTFVSGPGPSGSVTMGEMVRWFISQGVSPNGAAGIVGNGVQENGLSPVLNSGGLGIWQVTPASGLLPSLYGYAHSHGLNVQTAAAQMGWLITELHGQYSGLLAQLNRAPSPESAADIFERVFENARILAFANRERFAREALQASGSVSSGVPVSTSVTPTSSTVQLTVKGAPATPSQIAAGKLLLGVGNQLNAPGISETAMIFAAIWESGLTQGGGANPQGYGGVLAGLDSAYNGNSIAQARSFLLGGPGFEAGGAIHLAQTGDKNPVDIAVRVEVPGTSSDPNYYAHEQGYPGDAAAAREAAAWVTGLAGVSVGGIGTQQCVLASATGPGQYVNPFQHSMAGLIPQRIDMGVDYDNVQGAEIDAIGRARILAAGTGIGGNWVCGGGPNGGVFYQLLDGPDAGRKVYVTEDVVPAVSANTIVVAGQKVAEFSGGNLCIEIGWGTTPWGTEASALSQVDTTATFCGRLMSQLIQSLGGKSGVANQPPGGSSCPVM